MKKILLSLSLLVCSLSYGQNPCDQKLPNAYLVFEHDSTRYIVDLENYSMVDIYKGNIHFIDKTIKRGRHKDYVPTKDWELFLMLKKNARYAKKLH